MGPILFTRDENIAYVMPRGTARAMMSCAGTPAILINMARQKLLMDVPFTQAELYLSKLTASHFNILNTKIANQNVLERILIAMHNENTAKSNENFRMGAEELVAPLYNR